MNPKFYLIDGNSFIHRAFHALPPLSTKDGFPTNAITGFFNMIWNVKTQFAPDRMVIVFDAKGKNFRHDLYSEYKANRPETDPSLKQQRQPIHDIVKAWGLPTLCINGVEADDSMSAMGEQASNAGYDVTLVTSDKDMAQMVSDEKNITLLDTKDVESGSKPVALNEAGVLKKFGVLPKNIIDYLALMGDNADNIPGVDGCGPKTAVKWIEQFKSVEGVIEHADEIKGAAGNKLRACIDTLKLSKELVTIKTDLDLGKPLNEFVGEANEDELYDLVTKFELKQFKKNLGLLNKDAESTTMNVITNPDIVSEFLASKAWSETFLHINEMSVESLKGFLVSSGGSNDAYLVDNMLHEGELASFVEDIVTSPSFVLCSLDVKRVLKSLHSVTGDERLFEYLETNDAMILDYVMNGGKKKTTPIEYLNDAFCDFNLSPLREKFKLNGKAPQWKKMAITEILEVKAEELMVGKKVLSQTTHCEERETLDKENALTPILASMEAEGVLLDSELLKKQGEELGEKIKSLEKEIYAIAGQEFNINSPKQVGNILFDVLEIPVKKRSTSEDVLKKLAADNPIIDMIFEHRSVSKLKSTFIDGLLSRMDENNRVHTTYNQDITITGRLSSEDPNLQNIPIRSEDGRKIRKAFIAKKGYKILALDYSQIELRILAHRAKEPRFIQAFNDGADIHTATACDIFKISAGEVTQEQRRRAKAINFGLIYGLGSGALSEDLGTTKDAAKAFCLNYFETYDQIEPYFEKELSLAKDNLYVTTCAGRKIPTKDLNSTNVHVRSHAERATKNSGIQGTAADIIKKAMIESFHLITENKERFGAKLLMQVHDELIFEVPEENVEELALAIKHVMEDIVTEDIQLDVPLVVEHNVADNWLEAH